MTSERNSAERFMLGIVCSLILIAGLAPRARAGDGPFYTPLNTFSDGTASKQFYIAIGVVSRKGFDTYFQCTNLDAPGTSAHIGVEVFDQTGTRLNDISSPPPSGCNGAVLSVPAGSTRTFATDSTLQLHEDCKISITSFESGSARIVSSGGRLACTAMVIDAINAVEDPPGTVTGKSPSAVAIKLIKKNKQAGD